MKKITFETFRDDIPIGTNLYFKESTILKGCKKVDDGGFACYNLHTDPTAFDYTENKHPYNSNYQCSWGVEDNIIKIYLPDTDEEKTHLSEYIGT